MRSRSLVVLVAAALALAAEAAAGAPAGFTEAPRLDPAASYVAGKPAHVYCADSQAAWQRLLGARYPGTGTHANGTSAPGSSAAEFSQFVCSTLLAHLGGRPVYRHTLGVSLMVFVHEAVHLGGERDESKAECAALQRLPRVATRFFGIRTASRLRVVMADARAFHEKEPIAFRRGC